MILLDTSVLIDARDSLSPWHSWAKDVVATADAGEGACVNTVVLSEASVRAAQPEQIARHLLELGILLLPLPISAAAPAAKSFAIYLDRIKKEGKRTENKIPLPDFFIGAHAEAEHMTLATRDDTRIRTYFPSVNLIVPLC